MTKQVVDILYTASRDHLINYINGVILKKGHIVDVVTNISPMSEPDMNGVSYADWLIIYRSND